MDVLTPLIAAAFYVLFAVSIWRYLQHRGQLELAVVLVFTSTAALFAVSFINTLFPAVAPYSGPIAVTLLVAQPALMVGLVGLIVRLPRWAGPAAAIGFVASVATFYLTNRSVAGVLFLVGYFALTEIAAAVVLIREGRRRQGFPRVRLTIAGTASVLFGLSIFISGLASAARGGGGTPADPTIQALSRSLALIAGLGLSRRVRSAAMVARHRPSRARLRPDALDRLVADRHRATDPVGRPRVGREQHPRHAADPHQGRRRHPGPRHRPGAHRAAAGSGQPGGRARGAYHLGRARRGDADRGPWRSTVVPRGRHRAHLTPRVADGPCGRAGTGGRHAHRRGAGRRRSRGRPSQRSPLPRAPRGRPERDHERRRCRADPLVHEAGGRHVPVVRHGAGRQSPGRRRRAGDERANGHRVERGGPPVRGHGPPAGRRDVPGGGRPDAVHVRWRAVAHGRRHRRDLAAGSRRDARPLHRRAVARAAHAGHVDLRRNAGAAEPRVRRSTRRRRTSWSRTSAARPIDSSG